MTLITFVLIGCVVGSIIPLIPCIRKKRLPDLVSLIEGALGGGLIVGAFHLVFCAFVPAAVAHLIDKEGGHIHPENVFIMVTDLHRIDFFVGGLATAVVGLYEIARGYQHNNDDDQLH